MMRRDIVFCALTQRSRHKGNVVHSDLKSLLNGLWLLSQMVVKAISFWKP